jgi:hypothetical protein
MEPFELLKVVADVCERLKIRYLTVGSLATIAFGEPRFTNDIDILLDLQPPQIDDFCRAFSSPEYYLSRAAVEAAVHKRLQFNIIHTTSALKVDCILPGNSPFDRSQMSRGVRKQVRDDFAAVFGSPEDVIIKKMEYSRLGESEKHLRDIAGVLRVSSDSIDRAYIEEWATRLGLAEIWQRVLTRLAQP